MGDYLALNGFANGERMNDPTLKLANGSTLRSMSHRQQCARVRATALPRLMDLISQA